VTRGVNRKHAGQSALNMVVAPSFSQLNAATLSNASASKALLDNVPSAVGLGSLQSMDTNREA